VLVLLDRLAKQAYQVTNFDIFTAYGGENIKIGFITQNCRV
jgi:hypothetical protein